MLKSITCRQFLILCGIAVGVSLIAGCGSSMTMAPGTSVSTESDADINVSGVVHGGQQPIYDATVTLWAAGTTGYGSAGTLLATTTTNSSGVFNFQVSGPSYTCPSSSSQLYIVSSGGQPTTGVTNSSAALMAALGSCSTVRTSNPTVIVNEATTIAGMFALAQFFTPNTSSGLGSIGASATNATGLANAMATANNLVNITTGQSAASSVSAAVSGYSTNPSVTITPESSKINTEANILSACINGASANSNCTTLFGDVSSPAALDTLQAAYYMAINPTSYVSSASNIAAIYGLATQFAVFTPVLSAQPTDWTLGITYGSSSTSTAGVYLMNYPTYLAVDGSGDVWMVNDASTSATSTANSVTEIGPTGQPLEQVLTGAGTLIGPAGIGIDPTGNVWVPNYGSSSILQASVAEYTTGAATNKFNTNNGPQRLAIDGKGNVFVIEPSYKGLGDLEEIPAGTATGASATTLATGLTTDFSNLAIDSNYTIWVTGGGTGASGGTAGYPYLYQFLYSSTSPNYPSTPSATTNAGGIAEPEQAISIDNSNNVFVENYGAYTLSELSGKATITGAIGSPFNVSSSTGLTKPEFQVTDGAGNLWVTDAATTTASPAGSVYEISNAGVLLSEGTGYAHTYDEPYGIAVDGSGNVWVGAYAAAEPSAFVTEIVGAAVPVVTPVAAGLPTTPGGTSKLGTRP